MTQAITTWEAFGWERDEPVTNRFRQVMVIRTTGLNTDTVYDFDQNSGTFWTAVGNANALATIKNIATIAKCFLHLMGPEVEAKTKSGGGVLLVLDGVAGSGAASVAVTATGLLTTDVILAITQNVKGGNSLPLLGYNSVVSDGFTAVYSADPGAGGHLKTTVYRPSGGTPQKGQYVETVVNTRPDVVFASGDAPTAATFWMEWDLQPGQRPIFASGGATT